MSLLDLEGNALIGQSREWNVSLSGVAVSGEGTGSPIQRTAVKETISRDTISRWTKNILNESGIDTSIYSAHSTRAASTSKANLRQVPIDVIMNNAGWKSAETFRRFCNKPIDTDSSE